MQKAVIYARYSSSNQREESIDGQIRECMEFAKRKDIDVINVYIDKAMSAKTDDRPHFLQMVQDSKKRTFDYVIVYSLDRFSRNRYDSVKYKHDLKQNGVKVLSAKENLSDDPTSVILESLLEGYAEFYSLELAQKVTRGMTDNILQGKWAGGTIPLGYKLGEDKKLIVDEHKAGAVRIIFDMYLKNRKLADIIRELNKKGYTTAKGKPFTNTNSLSVILKNEVYTGTLTWKDTRIEHAHAAIITTEDFIKVQKMRKNKSKRKGSVSSTYLLTTKLTCPKCGGNMIGMSGTSKTKDTHYYYSCINRCKHHTCDQPNIKRDWLENLIVDFTAKMLSDEKVLKELAKQIINVNKKLIESNTTIKALENEIDEKQKKLHNLLKAVESGVISDTITNAISEHESEIKRLEKALHEEKLLNTPIEISEEYIMFFLNDIARCAEGTNAKEKILMDFVSEVIPHPDCIEVRYNYNEVPSVLNNPVYIESSFSEIVVESNSRNKNSYYALNNKYFAFFVPLVA